VPLILLSIFIGLVTGVVQFYLLYKFVTTVTGGKSGQRTILFAITQFLFPFAVLVVCAFLLRDTLMWVGIGAAASLITSAVIKFFILTDADKKNSKKSKKPDKKSGSKK